MDVVATRVLTLTADVVLICLRRPDGSALPHFQAGAHVLLTVTPGVTRAYSLCGDPADNSEYVIAVRRESAGRGGSQALHERAIVGTTFSISAPRNHFPLVAGAQHHLLIAGGIGITPLVAMAHSLHRDGAPFFLMAFSRSRSQLPFAELLRDGPWSARVATYFDDEPSVDLAAAIGAAPIGTHVYCCGPDGFMRQMREACAAIPESAWHQESFGASTQSTQKPVGESAAGTVFLARSDRHIAVPAGSTLLDALHSAGVVVDSACAQGICGSCVVGYRDGKPEHGDACLSDEERKEYVALCSATCASATLTLEL